MSDSLRFLRSYLHWASIAALLLILPATHAAGLNDTGITTCSNLDTNGLPCPVADFPGQDAEFGTNGFNFTKLDAAGNDLPATATDHTCVRDNVTGLIWQVKLSDSTFTFDQAAGYVTSVNATGLCGFNDWRMPNPKELMGIADHGRYLPAINTNYFPGTPSSYFWSGSPYAFSSGYAWGVHFNDGYANGDGRDSYNHVRLVCGGQSFDTFADNNDGTVSQTNTGLMWAKCSEGQTGTNCTGTAKEMNWSAALTAANNSNLGGYNDWRLPNFKELQALLDYSRYSPAIDTDYFPNTPNTPSSGFWSGSPIAYYSGYAWSVYFDYGGAVDFNGWGYALLVRLVRGGTVTFDPFVLTVAKAGSGAGVVTSGDGKINCGSTCAADFASGSSIVLTAAPDTNSTFGGWSGACTNKTGDCTVIMSEAQTVTATFTAKPITYKLSVSKVGDGSVKSDPAGINCGSDCVASFDKGKVVTLTAKPDTNSTFVSWSGCTAVAANPLQCTVTMSKAQTVTATFAVIPTPGGNLTVKTVGNGNVTSDPAAINCGSGTLCTASFDSGTAVILTATPKTGETFKNWNGCTPASSTPNQCRVTLTSNKTVTATFSTTTTPLADVRVMVITLTPNSPAANSNFTAAITVKNLGNAAMNGGYMDVWTDQPAVQACKAAGDEWDEIGELAAGESKTLTIKLRATDAGMKQLHIFVDSRCETTELNEANNQTVKRYTVN